MTASPSSYTEKKLRVSFTLSNGMVFAGTNANQLVLAGLRMTARIECAGAPAFPTCELAVWGMRQSDMNALSTLTLEVTGITRNTVLIEADSGDGAGYAAVYAGQITSAFIDYSARPDVPLRVSAQVLFFDMVNPVQATSYTGPTPVATIISNLAAQMGCAFENNGVTTVMPGSPYFPGTLASQLRAAAAQAGIDMYQEPSSASGAIAGIPSGQSSANHPTVTIAICPKGAPRNLPSTFTLTPKTGLDGYPSIDSRGYIRVRSLFNRAFRFGGPLTIAGSNVVIEGTGKDIGALNSRANGNWMIGTLVHTLSALKFDSVWFSDMLLYPPDQSPPQA